jgi:hypothetical protein
MLFARLLLCVIGRLFGSQHPAAGAGSLCASLAAAHVPVLLVETLGPEDSEHIERFVIFELTRVVTVFCGVEIVQVQGRSIKNRVTTGEQNEYHPSEDTVQLSSSVNANETRSPAAPKMAGSRTTRSHGTRHSHVWTGLFLSSSPALIVRIEGCEDAHPYNKPCCVDVRPVLACSGGYGLLT